MKVILRFYRQHDLDLISLHKYQGFCMSSAIKKSLNAYVNNKTLCILAPSANKLEYSTIPKQVQLIVNLDENLDKKEIEWIKSLRAGMRNSAIKNLLRGYLSHPAMSAYSSDEEIDFNIDLLNEAAFKCNLKEITKLPLRYRKNNSKNETSRNKNKAEQKDELTGVEKVKSSKLAKEILSVPTLKSLNKDTLYVENIDEDKSKQFIEKQEEKEKIIEQEKECIEENKQVDDDFFDMFDDLENMMNNM